MSERYSDEIFRQEGGNFRSNHIIADNDGSLRISAHDMGKIVEETWGADEYEFWVHIPPAAIHKLAFALMREKYAGRSGAVDEFRAFCKKEGIEHKWDNWM
jgi:hypothetical protein